MRYLLLSLVLLVTMMFSLPINSAYAEVKPVQKTPELNPNEIAGETATLIDAKTGKVLFAKKPDVPMYPASITKIATGIYAILYGNPDDIVTVSKRARNEEGTRVYLAEGEKVPLRKLEYGLLMNSGNDAATAIAEHLAGSNEAFAQKLNAFLQDKVGVYNTHFTNPHGLHDPNHYTTAADMAKIAQFAMRNPIFRQIVATKTYPWKGKEWDTVLVNHNRLLWDYPGATGIKNGFTDQAHNTLVVSAKRGNTELIAVTLKAPSKVYAYHDVIKMLNFGFANYETKQVGKPGDTYTFSTAKANESEMNRYYVDKSLYVTVPLHADYRQKVTSDGKLVITLPSGEQESFQLAHKEQPTSANGILPGSIEDEKELWSKYAVFIGWLMLNIFLVYTFIKLRRRSRLMFRKNKEIL